MRRAARSAGFIAGYLVQQLLEHVLLDLRVLPQRAKHLLLPFELLQQVEIPDAAARLDASYVVGAADQGPVLGK